MENINIQEMARNIYFAKRHPEFKQIAIDLYLYDDNELLLFFSTKDDENYILNLMKYIEGVIYDFHSKDDFAKRDRFVDLYSRCTDAFSRIDENTETDTPELKPFAGLLKRLDDSQLDKLFNFLTTENKAFVKHTFIDIKTTDRDSFDYIFGSTEKPKKFISIEWRANKQFLIDLLTGLQKEVKLNKQNHETMELSNEIKRQTELYLIDSETKQGLKLPKNNNRLKNRPEYKAITNFLATI